MSPLSLFLFLSLCFSVRAEVLSSLKQHPVTASRVNVSSQMFPNTSSFKFPDFSYIIPYGQTQDCNIYGPICQTGSITVGVNLTTATTSTVLPCSSYLSTQFAYLEYEEYKLYPGVSNISGLVNDLANDGWLGEVWMIPGLRDWNINFGHSPECRSYAEAMRSGEYTFSECGRSNTVIPASSGVSFDYPPEIPPGFVRLWDGEITGTCCGNCSLNIPEVRLYYFPDKSTIDCHNNQTSEYRRSNLTSVVSARHLEKRVHSLIANGSTAIISGHTFTSPSIYLELMGTVAIQDQCTIVGPTLTNPIVTLPPGALTTWRPSPFGVDDDDTLNFFVGDVWSPKEAWFELVPDDVQYTAPLDVKDLACPTWGLGISTAANGTIFTTVGPPWLPLIQPPMNIFSLNPTWAAICTGIYSNFLDMSTLDLFDPPVALTPAPLLLPTPLPRPAPKPAPAPADPTTISQHFSPSAQAAKPASMPNDPSAPPAETGDPGKGSPTHSPAVALADPAKSASLPDGPASPNNKGDPASDSPSDPASDPPSDPKVPSVAGDPPADSMAPSSGASDPPPNDSQNSPIDPQIPGVPVPQGENPPTQTQGLGAIIYNAFGKSGPQIDGSSPVFLPRQSIFTIEAQTFTANPKGFKVNNAAVVPGGSAQTVDGTKISLDTSGVLAIGSSTISLTDPPATPALVVAGQTFTPNPSAFYIAGSTISAGGPAVTISGTIISLGQSGALAIGSSTIDLSTPSDTSPGQVYAVAGQTFTPNPSAFTIAGATISADGPAATIGGTIVSLDGDGRLKIGSSTISLPAPTDNSPDKVYTVAGQTFTPNPSAFSIAGTTVSADGPPVTISGTVVSLGSLGALAIGSSTFHLPTPAYTPSSAYTVAGEVFTPNPSTFSIAGTTISAGGSAVTIGGTIVSLQTSGTLIIGSSTIPLSAPQATFSSDVNIDGFDVEAESSFAVVDGVTLSAGAAGVTISGKVVSLEAGGATLDIGTGRFALPTPTSTEAVNGSVNVQAFTGGQSKGLKLSLSLICCVCCTLMLLMC